MKLWVSAEMESDVAEGFRLANNSIEDSLAAFLSSKEYDLKLDSLDCIAILRNDCDFKELHRYSPKKRDMDFRLVIDYLEFKKSTFDQQKCLILDMLIRAVSILSTKKSINKTEALKLRNDLQEFGAAICPIKT